TLWVLFVLSVIVLALTPTPEVIVMLATAALYTLYENWRPSSVSAILPLSFLKALVPVFQAARTGVAVSIWDIFFYFLKIGSVLFGSGYVLIAYIQQDVVNTFGWLTGQQLLDAVAIGQVTPGPVSTTTAVVGYIVAGLPGAIAATLGIFLPSFVLVIL